MDADPACYTDARNNMVDGQLRPNKVNDRRILDAMRRLPRELFVPPASRAQAYADEEAPGWHGRMLLAPMVVARLIQAADIQSGDKVLVLGAGYAAAVLAACAGQVTVLEPDADVIATFRSAMQGCGGAVTTVAGPLAEGWPQMAPYDCIFVDGGVPALPDLGGQLRVAPTGRLCGVVVGAGRSGIATLAVASGTRLSQRKLFDCAASVLPGFNRTAHFRF